jgi:hypothetical protein
MPTIAATIQTATTPPKVERGASGGVDIATILAHAEPGAKRGVSEPVSPTL